MIVGVFRASRETVRQVALGCCRYVMTRAKHGTSTANLKRRPRGAGVITTRPLERVEIDHFLTDVHIVCDRLRKPLGRPWLTAAVDHYSGAIVGYYLSLAPPSAASVLGALRHTILPKAQAVESANGLFPWLAYGIPDCVVVDNGLDLASKGMQDACLALGIELIYTPPRTPWYKGTIERFGRTMNTRFVHWLPGTTLGKQMKEMGYNAKGRAVLTFDDFKALFEQYITQIHNRHVTREKPISPDRRWLKGLLDWPVRLPESQDQFDAAVALTAYAKVQQYGIIHLGLQYQSDELGDLWNRVPQGTQLMLKVNPLDLRSIKVFHPDNRAVLSVNCVSDIAMNHPRTLAFHMALRQQARSEGLDPNDIKSLELAERAMRVVIEKAQENGKRTLKRMQAELLRQTVMAEKAERAPVAHTHESASARIAVDDFDKLLSGAFHE